MFSLENVTELYNYGLCAFCIMFYFNKKFTKKNKRMDPEQSEVEGTSHK